MSSGQGTRGGNNLGAKHPGFAIITQFGSPSRGYSVFKGKELNCIDELQP